MLALSAQQAFSNPLNPAVISGRVNFVSVGNVLTVTNTPGTIINWQGFSIGANEVTRFAQQSAASTVLNRVVSNDPSRILGALQSNGRVFLINPNGILFGAGSTVDVTGLVASTLNLSNADFLAGHYHFTQVPGARNIGNAGNITSQTGGKIYLIAPNVENTGVITASNGEILLAAGHSVDLVDTNNPNLIVNITAAAGEATNVGKLIASSGSLGLFGTVVKNSGTVSADSATLQGGKIVFKASQRVEAGGVISAQGVGGGNIVLLADMQSGTVNVAGTLDASAPNSGNGGFIETSAHYLDVAGISVNAQAPKGIAGSWLLDPINVTIASAPTLQAGGAFSAAAVPNVWTPNATGSTILNTTIQNALNTGTSVTITTTGVLAEVGDITVNAAIAKTAGAAATLTLDASNKIFINQPISSTQGALNLTLNHGLTGSATLNNSLSLLGGNVDVQTAGVTGTGTLSVTAGATSLTGALTAANLGISGGTLNLNGAGTTTLGTLNISGGILNDTGGVTLNGGINWSGGSITGAGVLGTTAGSNSTITGAVSLGDKLWNNAGTLNFNGAGQLGLDGSGALATTFRNQAGGVVNYNGTIFDTIRAYTSNTNKTFNNAGTLNKVVGSLATQTIDIAFNNSGRVNVNSGTLVLSGALTQSGKISVASGATLSRPAGFTNNGTLLGNGTFDVGAGTLTNNSLIAPGGTNNIVGTLAITGNLLMGAGSNLIFDLNGTTPGKYDVLNVSGTANLTGDTLKLYGVGGAGTYPVLTTGGLGGTTFGTFNSGRFTLTPAYMANNVTLGVTANSLGGYTYWTGGAGTKDWASALNWSNSAVPTTADNLYISPSANTVLVTAGAQSGNALVSDANLILSGGSLALAGNLNLPGTFTVSGGSWNQVATTLPAFSVGEFNFIGGTFIRALGGNGTTSAPYQLTDIYGIQGMTSALGNSYVLVNNIDATATANWNAGAGFVPVGDNVNKFTGDFDGLGHAITGLTINRPTGSDIGLFGFLGVGGKIHNVGLLNNAVSGNKNVGVLAGSNDGNITGSYASGGMVGGNTALNGRGVGGLVGQNGLNSSMAVISNSYSSGITVSGFSDVGGLVGVNNALISDTYSGGGSVSGTSSFGGLVGGNMNRINNSYSSNVVAAGGRGLVGWDEMRYVNLSHWDIQTSGQALSGGTETGLSTAQMKKMANFAGGNIANSGGAGKVWRIYDGQSYPLLTGFLKPLTITADPLSATYSGTAYAGALLNPVYSPTNLNLVHLLGSAYGANAINAGSYSPALYFDQQGYDVSYVNGTLTIIPASLTMMSIRANDASKNYGTTYMFNGNAFTPIGLLGGDAISSVALRSSGAVNTANVGTYPIAVTPGSEVFSAGNASNYTISYINGTLSVNPAALSVTAHSITKTYNGVVYSGGNGVIYSGFVNGETAAVLGGVLVYGGSSQGATNAGSYLIAPGGLSSGNYRLSYNNGALMINAVPTTRFLPAMVNMMLIPGGSVSGSAQSTVGSNNVKKPKHEVLAVNGRAPPENSNASTLPVCR